MEKQSDIIRTRLGNAQKELFEKEANQSRANAKLRDAQDSQRTAQEQYDAALKEYQATTVGNLVDSQGNPVETESSAAAKSQLNEAKRVLIPYNEQLAEAQLEADKATEEYQTQEEQIGTLEQGLTDAVNQEAQEEAARVQDEIEMGADPTSTIKEPGATNNSISDEEALFRMQNAQIIGDDPTVQRFDDGSSIQYFDDGSTLVTTDDGYVYGTESTDSDYSGIGRESPVPKGAIPANPLPANISFKSATGSAKKLDLRVKIRVPGDYLVSLTRGSKERDELFKLGGIIFPYTPSIQFEHKADYTNSNPLHSNFNLYFYQRSSISSINISGKFTVQDDKDAAVLLSTQHLIRALTKMRTGSDSDSGAPPPICRLDAYGDFGLTNIPVAISSFRMDYPDSVDYYTIGRTQASKFGVTSVPTVVQITLTLLPMYSREEMQKFSVTGWLTDNKIRKSGIL